MRKLIIAAFAALLVYPCGATAGQNTGTIKTGNAQATSAAAKKRGPIFRATKDQIKQAQAILKQRGFYAGDASGKLDADTRTGLRKYQEAEALKVTGTLNRATLEKMSITLTDKQKAM
ncbi:MAG TPA: peptidoglycan-binding domain-containing protein [Pyrinomonadaceae bacterium]|jgi:peptidoglycan hydrolase-like protein with peptidoglycan-binding domain|nr:peptidoglycan-binding domain-containing protein [Pyrinomonadaceae bacterium]